jgi:hypothetical protein
MLTTFFALIFMFAVNPALLPNAFKPQSPIVYRGSSKPAVVPNFLIKGPAAVTDTVVVSPDSTCIITIEPSRADSLEAGTVDPQSFTPEEFEQQKQRAQDLWLKRKEFLDQLNGYTIDPWDWT